MDALLSCSMYSPCPLCLCVMCRWAACAPYSLSSALSRVLQNDVWITTNYGKSWTAQTTAAPFYPRENPNVVVAQNGVIALNGGNLCGGYGCTTTGPYATSGWLSDAWVSFDNGMTWQQLAATTGSLFAQAATVTDSNGYWYTIAGQTGPANNTNYAWTNSGYKSTLSLTSITSWASTVSVSVPSTFKAATVYSSPNPCAANPNFVFNLITANYPFEARVDSVIMPTMAPMAFTDSGNNIGVAPTGSWLLYGTQEDVWLSSNNGGTWSLLAGQSGNSLPGLDNVTWAATGSGNSGCSHRTTFNRFYWMGTSNQNSAAVGTTGTFFNYVSTDGQEWIQILDAASSTGMSKRLGNEFGICVVDQYERVYSILGGDTWVSNNLGVTFTPVQATNYFPLRQDHSGVIYTPSGSVESIVIIAGRIWSVATAYGADQVREQSTQQQQHTHALGHRRSAATAALPSRRLTALT